MKYSEPEYVEVTPEWTAKFEKFREEHKDDPIGNVADHVLYEDEKVRIWEMTLEPGECSDLHRHDHEYYLVIMTGDLVAGVTPPGSPVDSFIGKVPAKGNTVGVPKGNVEWAWNIGDETYHEFLIELKDT